MKCLFLKSPSVRRLVASVAAFVAAASLGVVMFLQLYSSYIDGILYKERLNQMKEVTTQLFEGLNDVLEFSWADALTFTNQLENSGITTAEGLKQFILRQEEVCEMSKIEKKLVAVDSLGRFYTRDGLMGITENMSYLVDEPEQVSFVSSTLSSENADMVFMYQLRDPLELTDAEEHIRIIYFGTYQAMNELNQYFDCEAYDGNNSVYVLDQNGSKISSANSTELLNGHNAYSVLRQMEYLHGSNFEQAQQELNKSGIAYSNAVLDGEEYYYALRHLKRAGWTLLFLIPSSYVAVNTVDLVDSTGSIIMTFAAVMLVLCVGFVYIVLRAQQKKALAAERSNTKRMEELNTTLEAKNEQLRQANIETENARRAAEVASEAKTSFLSNMSHDIRTPMNAIVGIADLLSYETEAPERVREYTRGLQTSSHHLLGLLNDILDMSRIENGIPTLNIEKLDLSEQISQIEAIVCPAAKDRRQHFEIRTEKIRHEQFDGDGTRLRQILLNILTNAVKYTPEGGSVGFTITELPGEPEYAVYRFVISDNGMGMTPEFIDTIFDPFTRAENSVTNKVQGTGLGMAITKNLVDMMGGYITIRSTPGKGSTFAVTLKFRTYENSTPDIHGLLVVGVDDELSVFSKAHGVRTSCAADLASAGELLSGGGFDVVLLDCGICGSANAYDIAEMRSRCPGEVRVVGLCRESPEHWMAESLDSTITTPFFWSKLESRLSEESAVRTESAPASVFGGLRFLCAEDNEMNAAILEANLKWRGASCKICPDGRAVVECFENAADDFDMILMDVQMPVMNGYEATRAIRNGSNPAGKRIPIIAMTANAFSDDIRACIDAGMDAHIAKPVDMSFFEKTVRSLRTAVHNR